MNRRGRNLAADKLGPSNAHLGHHASTQATYIFTANKIYNDIPSYITLIDEKVRFKSILKKHFLEKLNPNQIPLKPRNNPIIQPYTPTIDDDCSYVWSEVTIYPYILHDTHTSSSNYILCI